MENSCKGGAFFERKKRTTMIRFRVVMLRIISRRPRTMILWSMEDGRNLELVDDNSNSLVVIVEVVAAGS